MQSKKARSSVFCSVRDHGADDMAPAELPADGIAANIAIVTALDTGRTRTSQRFQKAAARHAGSTPIEFDQDGPVHIRGAIDPDSRGRSVYRTSDALVLASNVEAPEAATAIKFQSIKGRIEDHRAVAN
jgi:hypothetical protein